MEEKSLKEVADKLQAFNLAKVAAVTGIHRDSLRAIRNGGDCKMSTFDKLVKYLWG